MSGDAKDSWASWHVAVTGVNARAESPGPGCAVARCLRECTEFRGRVIALGYDVLDAGLYDRDLCHSGYLLPYPSAGQNELLERLRDVHEQERIDVLIPCLDAEIQNFIGIQRDLCRLGIKMLLPAREQFLLRGKDRLSQFCHSIGVLVPETKTVTDPSFFNLCADQGWPYPLIIKGIFYDATIANNPLEARAIFHKMVSAWGCPVLVQKVLTGDEFDLSAIGDGQGSMLGTVMMRKRALTDKGKAWAGVSVWDDEIVECAEKIVQALRWRGPLEVEVMKDHEGRVYLIEINPRFPAWIYLSHAVGRNLPIALLKTIIGDTSLAFDQPKSGTFFIRYAREVIVQLPQFESIYTEGKLSDQPDAGVKI
jgi:carbamoyl-phosphate synthase large subunit